MVLENAGVCLSKFLIGLSFLMIVGFITVNTYFIISMVVASDKIERTSIYNTLKFLGMGSWIAITIWFMISVLIFYIKNSGRPFKTDKHRINLKYIGLIFILWAVAFIIKSILSIFVFNQTFDAEVSFTDFTRLILIVLTQVLTDIAPCIAVLELKFIEIFKTIKHQTNIANLFDDDETKE